MFRFIKNIINTVIIVLAVVGLLSLSKNGVFDGLSDKFSIFSANKEKIENEVGDFSNVDEEFNIKSAVKVMGYKTVVAKHPTSGQKMIIVDSGKKVILTEKDLRDDGLKDKLEDLCRRFKYRSAAIDEIEIVDKGYMMAYGQNVPYVKFSAKLATFPHTKISRIISESETSSIFMAFSIMMRSSERSMARAGPPVIYSVPPDASSSAALLLARFFL